MPAPSHRQKTAGHFPASMPPSSLPSSLFGVEAAAAAYTTASTQPPSPQRAPAQTEAPAAAAAYTTASTQPPSPQRESSPPAPPSWLPPAQTEAPAAAAAYTTASTQPPSPQRASSPPAPPSWLPPAQTEAPAAAAAYTTASTQPPSPQRASSPPAPPSSLPPAQTGAPAAAAANEPADMRFVLGFPGGVETAKKNKEGFPALEYREVKREGATFPGEKLRKKLRRHGAVVLRNVVSEEKATKTFNAIKNSVDGKTVSGSGGSGNVKYGRGQIKEVMEGRMDPAVVDVFNQVYNGGKEEADKVVFEKVDIIPYGFRVLSSKAAGGLGLALRNNVEVETKFLKELGLSPFPYDACVKVDSRDDASCYFILKPRIIMSIDSVSYRPSQDNLQKRQKTALGPYHRKYIQLSNCGLEGHVDVGPHGFGHKTEEKLCEMFDFPCVQGGLVCAPVEKGGSTIVVVPGKYTEKGPDYSLFKTVAAGSNFVPLNEEGYKMYADKFKAIYDLKPGDLVLWLSRTPHGNMIGKGAKGERCVVFVAGMPNEIVSKEDRVTLKGKKFDAIHAGSTSTHWANMATFAHAGKHYTDCERNPGPVTPMFHSEHNDLKRQYKGKANEPIFVQEKKRRMTERYGDKLMQSCEMHL